LEVKIYSFSFGFTITMSLEGKESGDIKVGIFY